MEISTDSFDDDSTALWKISTSSSAILKFNATSSTKAVLDGVFEIINFGKLLVDSGGFQTDGTLHWTAGIINVADSAIADFGAFPETDPR